MHSSVALILSAAIAFAGLSSQVTEAGILLQCLSDNGSNISDFLKLLAHGDADHNVKVDDQGNCLVEGLKIFHSEALYDKIGVCCEGASSIPDPCEKVYSYQMCMRKADMEQLKKNWEGMTSS